MLLVEMYIRKDHSPRRFQLLTGEGPYYQLPSYTKDSASFSKGDFKKYLERGNTPNNMWVYYVFPKELYLKKGD